ncbi:MAG: DUF58 domain-containing protein, partial [Actinobacteria bacterium]|nr:DUF58 domain-containing protein [Actinomycetota bacterium]
RKGDPLRAVHWRSAARAGRLIVREYEEDLQTRVTVVISGRDWGEPPESAFEWLVSAAASIARYALKAGHPVDLIGPEARLTDANHTTSLDWLARLAPVDEPLTPLVRRASQRMNRRGTIVLLTSSAGRAGADLPAAVHAGRAAGTRPVAVAALASSWVGKLEEPKWVTSPQLRRGELLTIAKGKDLKKCLGA